MSRIVVHAKPGKSKEHVVELPDGSFEISVNSRPVDGEANEAVTKALAKHLGIAKSRVKLIKGRTATVKTFEIQE